MNEKHIEELLAAGLINEDTASDIQKYFQQKPDNSGQRYLLVFGILGALLVGLGIILILAHNWDTLSKSVKVVISFIPLLISQALCAYSLFIKTEIASLKETASTLLFLAIGASIALISQIYNIPGNFTSYLFVWMLLALPIVYLLKSNAAFIFYMIGITAYGIEAGYMDRPFSMAPWYWILLIAGLPYYYFQCTRKPNSNFTNLHHWLIALSVLICFNTSIDNDTAEYYMRNMVPASMNVLACFYLIGHLPYFRKQRVLSNPFLTLGSLGSIIMLLIFTFDDVWPSREIEDATIFSLQHILMYGTFILAVLLLINRYRNTKSIIPKPVEWNFILFALLWYAIPVSLVTAVVINFIVLITGVLTIREGAESNHLGILNYGLIIIAALTICRFFDTNLSFVWRGILFVLVGIGFFITNMWMIKRRKRNHD